MGGVFQFRDNNAVILTDICEEDTCIDVTRATAAKERAEARLAEQNAQLDTQRAQAALARALARLQAALNK
jgi:F-type H+-transporting ATPase subunit epsilon